MVTNTRDSRWMDRDETHKNEQFKLKENENVLSKREKSGKQLRNLWERNKKEDFKMNQIKSRFTSPVLSILFFSTFENSVYIF